ncbi:MAG: hypothetical protein LQ343_008077 [Gyalolechia ehrenbergii]|nr:MAG: hypothetical protein LQ343_008077 [Gyalolechia ehrenbergii]
MAGFDHMQGRDPRMSSLSSPSLTASASGPEPWGDFTLEPASGLDMAGPSFSSDYLDNYEGSSSTFASLEHSSSTDTQTISPSEMHLSAPASGALTFQSTPQTDFIDSPACYSNDTSPAWAFTDSPAVHEPLEYDQNIMNYQMFPDLPGEDKKEVVAREPVTKKSLAMSRKGSSPGKASPTSRPTGITKKKKSRGPLPEIKVDVTDPVAVKRARNTAAARTSRERKQQRVEFLEQELELWKNRAVAAGWRDEHEELYDPM